MYFLYVVLEIANKLLLIILFILLIKFNTQYCVFLATIKRIWFVLRRENFDYQCVYETFCVRIVLVENLEHNDFLALRNMVVRQVAVA